MTIDTQKKSFGFLSGNMLKLIAAFAMACDHIGVIFFPTLLIFKVIGRLAFPIFAFFIAEGCRHTRNKKRYFLTLLSCALVFQLVYFFVTKDSYLSIFVTFSFSILLIYSLTKMKDAFFLGKSAYERTVGVLLFTLTLLSSLLANLIFEMDYGFIGVLTPLFVSLFHTKEGYPKPLCKLDNIPVSVLTMVIPLSFYTALAPAPYMQIGAFEIPMRLFSFLSIPLLLFYSGKRGAKGMKYFFYVFYPLHLVILYAVYFLISK